MRIVRNFFAASSIAVLGVMLAAGSADAATQSVRPADTFFEGTYLTLPMCQSGGNTGIAEGKWKSFVCAPTRVGLDVWFSLYVTT